MRTSFISYARSLWLRRASTIALALVAGFLGKQVLGAGVQGTQAAGTAELAPLIPVVSPGQREAQAAHNFVGHHLVTK